MRIGKGSFNWGVKGRISLSPSLGASKAFRTASVEATTTASGPAAATRPRREAMLMSEAFGEGAGDHGVARRNLASPARERKPKPSVCTSERAGPWEILPGPALPKLLKAMATAKRMPPAAQSTQAYMGYGGGRSGGRGWWLSALELL